MRILSYFGLFFVLGLNYGQTSQMEGDDRLSIILDSLEEANIQRDLRIQKFLKSTDDARRFYDDGNRTWMIHDVDQSGFISYLATDNSGARLTTGVDKIGVEGVMGFNLDGAGVRIGIWDGGAVRASHQELEGRIISGDAGSGLNFHASHVAGTILASGVDTGSKGMAVGATALAFDFNNDDLEMSTLAAPDQSGLILSNHSYGLITGWNYSPSSNSWTWYGNSAVSEQEDYRFGYYSSGARLWDELAFNAPYYTIVKSAGNDRSDTGDGSRPADGPYDIISTNATAKNIITIGAVQKVADYTGPESVVMSSFSSWGPTDDGRIKPDFVAAGVNIRSTLETSDIAYGNLSGTSMAAPNATGTFVLLQQLYSRLKGGNFMRSSLLKGLIAHTVKKTGNDGPDYRHGWGLIDGASAASFLVKGGLDGSQIIELDLISGQTYSLSFDASIGEKVVATLCWTDPAGSVPPVSLDPTNLNLVNDLDMRISDADETFYPWVLNPSNPGQSAVKGDNFRDNIEKTEFIPNENAHHLTISHKGTLAGGVQKAFLLLSYVPIESDEQVMYWIAGDGDWESVENWSLQTGGTSHTETPSARTRVIIDANVGDVVNGEISLTGDVEIGSLVWLSESIDKLNLGGHTLIINGDLSITDGVTFTGEGSVIIRGDEFSSKAQVSIGSGLASVDLICDDESSNIEFIGNFKVNSLSVSSNVILDNCEIEVSDLVVSGSQGNLSMVSSDITILQSLYLDELSTISESHSRFRFSAESETHVTMNSNLTTSIVVENGLLNFQGTGAFGDADIRGSIAVQGNLSLENATFRPGSTLQLSDASMLSVRGIVAEGDINNTIFFTSDTKGFIQIVEKSKICLEYVHVSNIDMLGDAVVTVGVNGMVSNSSNWQNVSCEEVVYADFDYFYACEGGYLYLETLSSGNQLSYSWRMNDMEFSDSPNPKLLLSGVENVQIELTVSNESGTSTDVKEIDVLTVPSLESNYIVESGINLASFRSGDSYQWLKDGEFIDGATSRTFPFNDEPGLYSVLVFRDDCNFLSSAYVVAPVLSAVDGLKSTLYPNPVTDGVIYVRQLNELDRIASYHILSLDGKVMAKETVKAERAEMVRIVTKDFPKGMYALVLTLQSGNQSVLRFVNY